MGKKKGNKPPVTGSLVFSTSTDGNSFFDNIQIEADGDHPEKEKLDLRVYRDRKSRKGKVVTIVTGYRGDLETLKELGKELKKECGVGGTVKDDEILIQGDFRDKVVKSLIEKGYKNTKPTGG